MNSQEENSGSTNSSNQSGEAPLWSYVTKLEKQGAVGGTWSFRCNICSEVKKGSYSRVKVHLLGIRNSGISICNKATRTERLEMQRLQDEFEKNKRESGPKEVSLPSEKDSSKKRKSSFSPIVRAFGVEFRDQLDEEIARMFYTGGLPFNLARNPHYQRSYQFAAANKIDDYVPPGYNKLRTTLLQKEKNHVDRLLEPLKLTWKEKGVTIVSDGWSDPTRTPLIHSLRRNKLNTSRAQDLVYVHNNLRLLSRNSDQYEDKKTKMWDVGGDAFDSMEDVGFLEFANISLDEPDFENEYLTD